MQDVVLRVRDEPILGDEIREFLRQMHIIHTVIEEFAKLLLAIELRSENAIAGFLAQFEPLANIIQLETLLPRRKCLPDFVKNVVMLGFDIHAGDTLKAGGIEFEGVEPDEQIGLVQMLNTLLQIVLIVNVHAIVFAIEDRHAANTTFAPSGSFPAIDAFIGAVLDFQIPHERSHRSVGGATLQAGRLAYPGGGVPAVCAPD